jgi:hypothetical protein
MVSLCGENLLPPLLSLDSAVSLENALVPIYSKLFQTSPGPAADIDITLRRLQSSLSVSDARASAKHATTW